MSYKLKTCPKEHRTNLQNWYLFEWPKHAFGYYTIHNYIKLSKLDNEFENNCKIYCLNGDWTDGTFFYRDQQMFYIFSLHDSYDKIETALNLFDYSKDLIYIYETKYQQILHEALAKKNLQPHDDRQAHIVMNLKDEILKNKQIHPKNIQIKQLTLKDLNSVTGSWRFKCKGSHNYFKSKILYDTNVGAFNENDELIGFALKHMGSVGHFFVNHDLRGSGIGNHIVKAMSRKMACEDEDSVACIHKCNKPSLKAAITGGAKIINYDYQLLINLKPLDVGINK